MSIATNMRTRVIVLAAAAIVAFILFAHFFGSSAVAPGNFSWFNNGTKSLYDGYVRNSTHTLDEDKEMQMNSLTRSQCLNTFARNNFEIDRAFEYFSKKGGITKEFLDKHENDAFYRVKIINNRLYISKERDLFTRTWALAHFIQKAIDTSREPIPDIEFLLNAHDHPAHGCWNIVRKRDFEDVFLVPDFGFWSWPEIKQMSWYDIRQRMENVEKSIDWKDKDDKLFFRGAHMDGTREDFFARTADKDWADVREIKWDKKINYKDIIPMEDHCKHKFIASIGGVTYSGRLKNLLLCSSLVIVNDMDFLQHFSHLLYTSGAQQNIYCIPNDQIEKKMKQFREDVKNGNDQYMKDIIDHKNKLLRETYLTMPALLCYWRELFHKYAELQKFNPELTEKDVPFESFALMRRVEWDMY